jgi:membrane-bound inhibitor of C-type lysozyme
MLEFIGILVKQKVIINHTHEVYMEELNYKCERTKLQIIKLERRQKGLLPKEGENFNLNFC